MGAEEKHGKAAADRLWRRVQVGFVLADSVRTTPKTFNEMEQEAATAAVNGQKQAHPERPLFWDEGVPLSKQDLRPLEMTTRKAKEDAVLAIFRKKAYSAMGLHSACMGRIAGRKIGEWLTPQVLDDETEACRFMDGLASSPVWIKKGPGYERSKLLKEFEWGGRMFGAFTNSEVATLRGWIASLPTDEEAALEKTLVEQESLDARFVRPYHYFLDGSTGAHPDVQGSEGAVSSSSSYFGHAILPMDLSSHLQSTSSFSSWVTIAPEVYRMILQHPHGVHGIFNLDATTFMRRLLPRSFTSASPDSGRLVQQIIQASPRPHLTSEMVSTSLLPSLFLSAGACFEWMPAASPVKLASPLGMCIVKLQRSLYGFAAEDTADEDEGCAGTDDVTRMPDGLWELASQLVAGGDDLSLDSFVGAERRALALPAMILLLNSQPTLHLPLLLGIQLGLNVLVHEALSKNVDLQTNSAWRERMTELTSQSSYWLEKAISLGASSDHFSPAERRDDGHGVYEYSPTRGWEGEGDWTENVVLGFGFVGQCLSALA